MYPAVRELDLITYSFSIGLISPFVTTVVVTSSNILTVENLIVAVASDIENTPALVVTYQTNVASIPGTGHITVDTWPNLATNTTKINNAIVISDGLEVGIATLTVDVPAQIPGSPPTPDPIISYPCSFKISTSQDKLISN
jgi:hypothetical protein